MGNEVKKLIWLKAHLSRPYQDLRDDETKRNNGFLLSAEIFVVISLFHDEVTLRQVNKISEQKTTTTKKKTCNIAMSRFNFLLPRNEGPID